MKDYYGKDFSELKNKKLWLFDMDGTVYLGDRLFDGTLPLLENITANGGRYVFITNNSSKSVDDYIKKTAAMGIPADKEKFYTSADAAAMLLKERFKDELIYAQGTRSFVNGLKSEGLNITTDYDENAKAVIVGFDTELTMKKLETTCRMLNKDVPYYATNPDWVCPTEFGYIPDCGSMCFGIEKATGKTPVFIGKPNPVMITEAMKKFNVCAKDTVVVGDRIYTDIAAGVNADVDTVLVFSGETTIENYLKSEVKSTYALGGVEEINALWRDI